MRKNENEKKKKKKICKSELVRFTLFITNKELVSFTAGASYQIHFMLFLAGFYFRSGHFFFEKKKQTKQDFTFLH